MEEQKENKPKSEIRRLFDQVSAKFEEKFHGNYDEQEAKNETQALNKLHSCLMNVIERVSTEITDIVQSKINFYSCRQNRVEKLQQKLKQIDLSITNNMQEPNLQFYSKLQKLEKQIDSIKPDRIVQQDFSLEFNEQELYRSIMEKIQVKGCSQLKCIDLIYPQGVIDITKNKKYALNSEINFLQAAAYCQLQTKLFCSGGSVNRSFNSSDGIDRFFSCGYNGKCEKLAPLLLARSYHSLTGSDQLFIVTGGKGENIMKTSQKYEIIKNKWNQLPQMVKEKVDHASCIINETRVFCFGRSRESGIEYLDLGIFQAWKQTPHDFYEKIESSFLAVPLRRKIYIFSQFSSTVFQLNYDGKFEQSWKSPTKPSNINTKALNFGRNCLYTCTLQHKLFKFDGIKWEQQNPKPSPFN